MSTLADWRCTIRRSLVIAASLLLGACGAGDGAEVDDASKPEGAGAAETEEEAPFFGFSSEDLTIGAVVVGTPSLAGTGEVVFEPSPSPDAIRSLYSRVPAAGDCLYAEVTGTFPSLGDEWCMFCTESVRLEPDTALPVSKFAMYDGMILMPGGLMRSEFDAFLAESAEGPVYGLIPTANVGTMEAPDGSAMGRLEWAGEVLVTCFDPAKTDQLLLGGPDGAHLVNEGNGLVLKAGSALLLTRDVEGG